MALRYSVSWDDPTAISKAIVDLSARRDSLLGTSATAPAMVPVAPKYVAGVYVPAKTTEVFAGAEALLDAAKAAASNATDVGKSSIPWAVTTLLPGGERKLRYPHQFYNAAKAIKALPLLEVVYAAKGYSGIDLKQSGCQVIATVVVAS